MAVSVARRRASARASRCCRRRGRQGVRLV